MQEHKVQSAFSLVELSIVLVILGLLVGGILSGQSLIRAAELRAVTTEYNRYFTSVQTFRDKYFAYPGDFRDATRFWGRQMATAECATNSAASVVATGVCDGNGDGVPQGTYTASTAGEQQQFWRHLASAGLIEGTYTGLAGPGSSVECVIGTNCPRSKMNSGGWSLYSYGATWAGDTWSYAGNYGNAQMEFGGTMAGGITEGPILKPEEAWNIDTKVDDGKPGTGRVIARFWNNACATASSVTDYASPYRLTDSSLQCSLYFRNIF